jgi:hypothetical protein
MPELQVFEEVSIPDIEKFVRVHEYTLRYKPLIHIVAEPANVLHCDESVAKAALIDLGEWVRAFAVPGSPGASRAYSVRVGPIPFARMWLNLFEDSKLVERVQTDEKGRAVLTFNVSATAKKMYTVTVLPRPLPLANPLQDTFKLSVWLVTARLAKTTDIWLRLVGRSFNERLPRIFWRESPWWVIGLGFVGAFFADIVPVFSDMSFTLYYGISAMCNTEEPYPPREKCIAYRRNTWWTLEIEVFNGVDRKRFSHDINVDRQVKLTVTADDVRSEVIRPEGAET